MKLIGATNKLLIYIYIKEMLLMQIISIPLGYVISQIMINILTILYEQNFIQNWNIIATAIGLHLLTILVCVSITLFKLVKFNIIKELRNDIIKYGVTDLRHSHILKFFLSFFTMIVLNYFSKYINYNELQIIESVVGLFKLLVNFILYVLMFDFIIILSNKIIICYNKKIMNSILIISVLNLLGNYKKIKPIIIMLIIGITVSAGLQSLYITVREDAYKSVINNVFYSDKIVYDNYLYENMDIDSDFYTSISTYLYDVEKEKDRLVIGIDKEYTDLYENIESNIELTDNRINEMLNNPSSNHIYVPEGYITKKDIGKKYIFKYDDKEIVFVIAGAYYNNNLGEFIFLVNNSYLQSQLEKDKMFNTIYLKSPSDTLIQDLLKIDFDNTSHYTKIDQAVQSYDKAVSGTTLVVISSMIVFICALLMLASFFVITAKQNSIEIARLRGAGVSLKNIFKIYMYQILTITFSSLIFALPFISYFCNVGRHLVLHDRYFLSNALIPYQFISILMVSIIITAVCSFLLSVNTSFKNEYIYILRDMQS
jgi:ABC-type antimicrobial peptide transport system permease subunit